MKKMTSSSNAAIKELHALACSVPFNNSALYPYTDGLPLMVIFFFHLLSSTVRRDIPVDLVDPWLENKQVRCICSKRTKSLSLGLNDTQTRSAELDITAIIGQ